MKLWMALLLVLFLAAVAWFAIARLPGRDERLVRRQFAALEKVVSKQKEESPVAGAVRARTCVALFADPCEVLTQVDFLSGSFSREDIAQQLFYGRSQFRKVVLKFHDLHVEFPSPGAARCVMSATLQGDTLGGDVVREVHEVHSALTKVGSDWLFQRMEVVDVLVK
jgi:hypothetical protein